MIVISAALCQDKIKEYVNNFDYEGVTFSFKEKIGIQLNFEASSTDIDLEKAARAIKLGIKEQEWGSILFFQCTAKK
ncbi:hypothetical protein [Vagococcus lutrae]|uniref:hypothetical protein n=1 Tax=Vagococcus lutrae TaxID=81947 RepID=UPI0020972642|nr:hypothetical protein [Vagococcus lutrae]MDO5742016.1 hypothetical protein [Vagococcus sp.]MCO7151504.1 hypothetical protein [Vagococcus lutrae]MDT2812491.1 hypothetical protein [Vagococcus lutrae]MDT2819479.1 hypothetical protein [Vagococcus lutrae]MDT2842707.1 hypothetical protein [Vagococcus lutrae]